MDGKHRCRACMLSVLSFNTWRSFRTVSAEVKCAAWLWVAAAVNRNYPSSSGSSHRKWIFHLSLMLPPTGQHQAAPRLWLSASINSCWEPQQNSLLFNCFLQAVLLHTETRTMWSTTFVLLPQNMSDDVLVPQWPSGCHVDKTNRIWEASSCLLKEDKMMVENERAQIQQDFCSNHIIIIQTDYHVHFYSLSMLK